MSSQASSLTQTVQRAYALARSGDLAGAGTLCEEVLRTDGSRPEALLLRAVIAVRTGRPADALEPARRALVAHPARASIHALLGDALYDLKRFNEALTHYGAAIREAPEQTSARFGQARSLLALGRPSEAVVDFEWVLARQPDDFEALTGLGQALFETRDLPAALAAFERAATLSPFNADVHCNRGAVLLMLKRTEEALFSLDLALSLAPELIEAHQHRGQALQLKGDTRAALAAFENAIRTKAEHAPAWLGRGETLWQLGRLTDARDSFERALKLDPSNAGARRSQAGVLMDLGRPAEALSVLDAALLQSDDRAPMLMSRGNSLRALGRHAEALADYEESLRLDSDSAATWCEYGHALRGMDRSTESVDAYVRALALDTDIPFLPGTLLHEQWEQADWSVRTPVASRDTVTAGTEVGKPMCAPFAFLSVADEPAAQRACAETACRHQLSADRLARPRPRHGHTKVRLAYVSCDLREHAVSYLMAGVLEQHDRERFEVTAIALRPPEDSATGVRVQAAFDHFIDVSAMNDREILEKVRGLEIDVAVDLTGHTRGSRPRLFAAGLAPVQVSYLGYPGTTGSDLMDYLIADEFVVPESQQQDYAEAIAYLPDCFQANDDQRVISERRFSRQEQGLPESALVLCCMNNTHKLNPRMFDVWVRLLHAEPRAVLWLLAQSNEVRENLRREAASRGIDPERLVFAERLPYPEHLSRLQLADLFLDTLPFNAGTTASDALWAGVPVVTCAGRSFAARMAGSLLCSVGLPELVTTDLSSYESLALRLMQSPQELWELRARLATNRSSKPLFDTRRFTRNLESAYLEMWARHERGALPASFRIAGHSAKPA